MVDTREVFAGLYTGGRQPPWKARLDELLPDPAATRDLGGAAAEGDDAAAEGAAGPPKTHSHATPRAGGAAALPRHRPPAAAAASSGPLSASSSSASESESAAAAITTQTAPATKRKQAPGGREGDEQTGPFYDEGADLKDELWVTDKYLRHHHQPARPTQKQQEEKEKERGKKTRPDDWTSDRNDPLTRPRRSDAVLSCPCCFTPLCYDCQRHDVYLSQYRAMFVTDECTARLTESRTYEGDQYHPVHCAICETEVGVFEPADELYHFFNVIPGN